MHKLSTTVRELTDPTSDPRTAPRDFLRRGSQPRHCSIRRDAVRDRRLVGHHDVRVLLHLDEHGAGDVDHHRGQQKIADDLGVCRHTVQRALSRLQACGYLIRVPNYLPDARGFVRRLTDSVRLVGRRHRSRPPSADPPTPCPIPPNVAPVEPRSSRGKALQERRGRIRVTDPNDPEVLARIRERAARILAEHGPIGEVSPA